MRPGNAPASSTLGVGRRDGAAIGPVPLSPAAEQVRANRRLDILIVTSEAPPVVSGISKTVGMLQQGLSAQGHRVDVVSRADYPAFVHREIRLSTFAWFWPSLRRQVSAYDVVNLHGPVPTISETFLMLAQTLHRSQRPTVVYTHHSDLAIPSFEALCEVYNKIVGALAHRADAVVVSSQAYHHKLSRVDGTPVSVVPWAIDTSARATGQEPTPRDRPEGAPLKVLFVGQLRVYKGLHVLLDAVKRLGGVELTVVGDGPLRDELQARIEREELTNVTMVGRLTDDELWPAYAEHDVIALPSLTTAEAYGLVLAEGMTAGCIPIASALPGVREVAEETGLVFPPGDASGLREAFRSLAQDPARARALSEASLRRSESFSVPAMADRYERIFRSAAARRSMDRAADAVTASWQHPDDLLTEAAEVTGVREANLWLLARDGKAPFGHVWRLDGTEGRAHAPVAQWAADHHQPVLLTPGVPIEPGLRPLLRRADITSSILVPVRRTRGSVSVIGLATTEQDGKVLTRADLQAVQDLLEGRRASARLRLTA